MSSSANRSKKTATAAAKSSPPVSDLLGSTPLTPSWPDSVPTPGLDSRFVSVYTGDTHLNWALNGVEPILDSSSSAEDGEDTKYDVRRLVTWRTPYITPHDVTKHGGGRGSKNGAAGSGSGSSPASLSVFLPARAQHYVFGGSGGDEDNPNPCTYENAKRACNERKSYWSGYVGRGNSAGVRVYIASSNQEQTRLITQLFSCVPSYVYLLRGEDFFTAAQGRYEAMDVERCAALLGGIYACKSRCVLVFDGGNTMTHTATNGQGRILGGGTGCGLNMKFLALKEHTCALPRIMPDDVTDFVTKCKTRNGEEKVGGPGRENEKGDSGSNPLPIFARNTKEAIMGDVLAEAALRMRQVIKGWLDQIDESNDYGDDAGKEHHVIFTGGDCEVLMSLCDESCKYIIDLPSDGEDRAMLDKCTMRFQKSIVHRGINSVLAQHIDDKVRMQKDMENKVTRTSGPELDLDKFVHQRVAKEFEVEDDEGDSIFRGSIIEVLLRKEDDGNDDDYFLVEYDDGETEHVNLEALQKMLVLYQEVGEKEVGVKNSRKLSFATAKRGQKKTADPASGATQSAKTGRAVGTGKQKPQEQAASDHVRVPKRKRTENKASPIVAKKKAKKGAMNPAEEPGHYENARVAKWFHDGLYFGRVTGYVLDIEAECGIYWHIEYDDGDEEDYDQSELVEALQLYGKKKNKDTYEQPHELSPRPSEDTDDIMVDALASLGENDRKPSAVETQPHGTSVHSSRNGDTGGIGNQGPEPPYLDKEIKPSKGKTKSPGAGASVSEPRDKEAVKSPLPSFLKALSVANHQEREGPVEDDAKQCATNSGNESSTPADESLPPDESAEPEKKHLNSLGEETGAVENQETGGGDTAAPSPPHTAAQAGAEMSLPRGLSRPSNESQKISSEVASVSDASATCREPEHLKPLNLSAAQSESSPDVCPPSATAPASRHGSAHGAQLQAPNRSFGPVSMPEKNVFTDVAVTSLAPPQRPVQGTEKTDSTALSMPGNNPHTQNPPTNTNNFSNVITSTCAQGAHSHASALPSQTNDLVEHPSDTEVTGDENVAFAASKLQPGEPEPSADATEAAAVKSGAMPSSGGGSGGDPTVGARGNEMSESQGSSDPPFVIQ